jgi:CRP/FNR family transcriptional regulator, cyclic AMP receptor protein
MTNTQYGSKSRNSEPQLPVNLSFSLRMLLSQATITTYAARKTIVNQGDISSSMFFIVSGSVAIISQETGKRDVILAYLNEGSFFGEMGLFEKNKPLRTALVRTRVRSHIIEINYDQFLTFSKTYPELLFDLCSQLSFRLKETTRKVTNLTVLDVTGRIARCLLDLSNQPDALIKPDGKQIHITRQEIGKLVGCSREMVGRVLKTLEEQHTIKTNGKTILIYNTDLPRESF